MPIVLIPVVLVLLYMAERYIFNRFWERNLSVNLEFEKENVTEGESAALTEVVTNRNFLPLHILQVHFQTDPGLDFGDETNVSVSDRVNVTDVFSLRFYEKITRNLNMVCAKRGFYNILRTSMTASDLFSSDIHYATRDQRTSMYVYPRFLAGDMIDIPFKQLMGEVMSKRFLYEDKFTFRGIRDYAPTDPISSINWKASARTGNMKVNQYDYTASPEVMLVLNVEEPGILFETELIEDCIRLTVTIADKLMDQGVPVSLLTNGRDKVTGEVIRLNSGVSAGHVRNFLRALARIDTIGHETAVISELVEAEIKEAGDDTTFCYISCSRRDDSLVAAGKLADVEEKLLWLCPLVKSMDQNGPEDKRISFVPVIHE